jgi:hypothetical protein
MVFRRQVAYPFFRVVQIRTALVMTPWSDANIPFEGFRPLNIVDEAA